MTPKVNVNACTDCPHFLFSGEYGVICTGLAPENPDLNIQAEESVKLMLTKDIYEQYNIDFQSGTLFSKTPDWCPLGD